MIESREEMIEKLKKFCNEWERPCCHCPLNEGVTCYAERVEELTDEELTAISSAIRIIKPYVECADKTYETMIQVSARLNKELRESRGDNR